MLFFPESEPDFADTSLHQAAGRTASQQQKLPTGAGATTAAPASPKGRPATTRPAFEIQYNAETDGAAGRERREAVPPFAPTGGAFRLIEVAAANSTAVPPKDADVKVMQRCCGFHVWQFVL